MLEHYLPSLRFYALLRYLLSRVNLAAKLVGLRVVEKSCLEVTDTIVISASTFSLASYALVYSFRSQVITVVKVMQP